MTTTNANPDVDRFLAGLKHRRLDDIRQIRAAILASNSAITERIKWNAPSFCWNGDDRVTFRLQPNDRVELVFHRGVTKRDPDGFGFDDPTNLISWVTPDRGVIRIDQPDGVLANVIDVVGRWMHATVDQPGGPSPEVVGPSVAPSNSASCD